MLMATLTKNAHSRNLGKDLWHKNILGRHTLAWFYSVHLTEANPSALRHLMSFATTNFRQRAFFRAVLRTDKIQES